MIIIFVVSILMIYMYLQSSQFKIKTIKLHEPISEDFKILQVSDFHSNEFINQEHLMNLLSTYTFDAIVLTGDLVSRNTDDFSTSLQLVDGLKCFCKDMFFVSGNHEAENPKIKTLFEELEKRDVKILNNESVKLRSDINLLGVPTSTSPSDIQKLIDESDSKFNILLSHIPTRVTNLVSAEKTLVLSGHTHGGQVRLPVIGQIITPEQPLFGGLDKGITKLNENVELYIDSGLGNSKFPIRTFNNVQVSIIDLIAK